MNTEQRIYRLEKMVQCLRCNNSGGGGTSIHNNLQGLQGGQPGQYYHLTQEQYDSLGDFDQENTNVVHTFTLDDIGADGTEDEETLNQLIVDYINSQGIVQGETENHYFILVDGNDGGGGAGDYIPLSGTEAGKPVTGFIATSAEGGFGYTSDEGTEYNLYTYEQGSTEIATAYLRPDNLTFAVSNLELHTETGGSYKGFIGICVINNQSYIDDGHYDIDNCAGLYSDDDYSNNFPENKLIYAQRSYVDRANSYSTTETKTGGTWIDGKPIYTITKLTADPIPADIETQFPNIIVGSYTVYKYTKTTD